MLVLITNSRVPYCFDVAHVLGMPLNLSHRFRYRKRWIATDADLSQRKALVVLRDFDTGGFIPIRFAEIDDVLVIGDMVYLDFRLQGLLSAGETERISVALSEAMKSRGFANTAGSHLETLVMEVPEVDSLAERPTKLADDALRWNEVLVRLGQLECYKDYGFLRVLQIVNAAGRTANVTEDGSGRYAYALAPGTLYYLDVVQQTPWHVDDTEEIQTAYDVELVAESDEVVLLRKVQRVVGKYDLLRFIFKTPYAYGARHTFLELTDRQVGAGAQFRLPTLFLPVFVQPTGKMQLVMWVRRVAGVASIATFIASGVLAPHLGSNPELVRTVSLLVLVIASQRWEDAIKAFVDRSKDATL